MSVLDSLITAINNQFVIEFEYNKEGKGQGKRIGHPYAVFIHTSTTGLLSVKVHILQIEGVSDSKEINPLPDFRMFNLEDIDSLVVKDDYFLSSSNKYNSEWEGYLEAIAQVKLSDSYRVHEITNNQFFRLFMNTSVATEGYLYHLYAVNNHDEPLFSIRMSLMEARTLFEYLYGQSSIRNHQQNYLQRQELPVSFRVLLEQIEARESDAITVLLQYYSSEQRIKTLQHVLTPTEITTLYHKHQYRTRKESLYQLSTVIDDRSFRAANFTSWLYHNTWALGQLYIRAHSVSQYDKLPTTSLLFETADHFMDCVLIYDAKQKCTFSSIIGECVQISVYLQQQFPSHFIRLKCIIPDELAHDDSLQTLHQQIPAVFFLNYTQVRIIAQRLLSIDE